MQPINRSLLKENAKIALKNNFWIIMAVVLVGSILGYNWSGITRGTGSVNINGVNNSTETLLKQAQRGVNDAAEGRVDGIFDYQYDDSKSDMENIKAFYNEFLDYMGITHQEFMTALSGVIIVILLIIFVIDIIVLCLQFLVGSFLSAPVGVGVHNFFMKNRKAQGKFTDMFSSFTGGKYMKIVKSMFIANIQMYAWSLLFVIPGWVKYYQLYFVSYIMAENPDITPARAREISKQMTQGHKWQIFVLELSFLGWIMLATLLMMLIMICSCFILTIPSVLVLYPVTGYQQATFAELYAERREYALMTGIATADELRGF